MAYLPFIFFGIIFLFTIAKRGFDVSAYVVMLYLVISFFAILMYLYDYGETTIDQISFFSPLLYCILIGLCLFPAYKFNSKTIKHISFSNNFFFDALTYFYFAAFLFTIIAYWKDLLFVINYGDWGELRWMITRGDSLVTTKFHGLLKYVALVFNFLGSISFIMFPIFFMSVSFKKRPWWFSVMAFLGTTTVIFSGILGCDRSSTFRWILLLGLNIVFFWPHISTKVKKAITPMLLLAFVGAVAYMSSVTSDRFKESYQGIRESVVVYAGQSYYNFCYLFDNYNNGEGFSTNYFFPATHSWIIKDYEGNVPRQQELTLKTGYQCGVFYTFLGSFLIDANQAGPFVFVIVFLLISSLLKKPSRAGTISFLHFIEYYFLLVILVFGIIAYPYTTGYATVSIALLLILLKLFDK
ncbi:MAG: O-antigen polymerase [Candidatus Cryptobacteroides sp.]|jgi:oligosaccharide repeat unit polymerase